MGNRANGATLRARVMFQIYVESLAPLLRSIGDSRYPIHFGPREVWRLLGEGGQREVFVLDPDGYLVMLAERLGHRPVTRADGR